MNSWWIKTDTAQLVLEMRDVPEPRPAAGEVIVRVRAAALNRGEFMVVQPRAPQQLVIH